MGAIVMKTNEFDEYDKYEVGHIVGLTRVFYTAFAGKQSYYIAPVVKFADKEPYAVHPNNLEILED